MPAYLRTNHADHSPRVCAPAAVLREEALRAELAVLRARVAQLEAQAPDAERERLITKCSLEYLVKYAAKPVKFAAKPISCAGRGGRGSRGGRGGRGSICPFKYPPASADQETSVYSKDAPVQLELSDDATSAESSWC